MPADRIELTADALKALAHPIRVRIMNELAAREQASVTVLAGELDESTSTISYHLRQLARHGLVEPVAADASDTSDASGDSADRGRGRPQQPWRRAADDVHLSAVEFLADPDTRAATTQLLRAYESDRSRRLARWYDTAADWPLEWQRASSDADNVVLLSPAEARALADELAAVVARHRAAASQPAARPVTVQYAVFPAETDRTRP